MMNTGIKSTIRCFGGKQVQLIRRAEWQSVCLKISGFHDDGALICDATASLTRSQLQALIKALQLAGERWDAEQRGGAK